MLQRRLERLGWLFLAPALLLLAATALVPFVQTLLLSFTDARFGSGAKVRFVGLGNYRALLENPDFVDAVRHTLLFTGSSLAGELVLGVLFALLLHGQFRGRAVLRAAVLLPWAVPTVVAAKLWSFMLLDTSGVVNDVLVSKLGLLGAPRAFLGEPGLALASLVAIDIWKTTPFVAILTLAGLQSIPPALQEAAAVDGAGPVRRFFSITLPLLAPVLSLAALLRALDALRVFDIIWVTTRGESATESLATFTYRTLVDFRRLGLGSAASVMLLLGVLACILAHAAVVRWRARGSAGTPAGGGATQ